MKRLWFLLSALWLGAAAVRPARAIPVIDVTNFAQNLITAIESVDQTLTMIQDFQLQMFQLEELVRNGLAPAVYVWDRIDSIQSKIRNFDLILYEKWQSIRNIDDLLRRFGDLDFYRRARCYNGDLRCTPEAWRQITSDELERYRLASAMLKQTADDLVAVVDDSEQDLVEESENLQRLQMQAAVAEGQMAAIQAGNQLASAQAQQLMQIRSLLIAHYRVMALQLEAQNAELARGRAVRAVFYAPRSRRTTTEELKVWPGVR